MLPIAGGSVLRLHVRPGASRPGLAGLHGGALALRVGARPIGGAASMLSESGLSARELRDMVISPGGTTLAGLGALEQHHFREAVITAVETATRRARELAAA